ncbi:unnamed protein product [Aphanomyces euteiches]
MAAAVNASVTLTQCWRQNGNDGLSVPCLNNTANGTITYFPLADNQSYSFVNLNISDIQALPPGARWMYFELNDHCGSVFRGNNLTSIRWGYDNFPTQQLSAVYNQA